MIIVIAAREGPQWMAGPENEQPAPPDQLVVTMKAGMRLTGAAARIDIKHLDVAKAPGIEVASSASDSLGRTWTIQAMAPSDFLETFTLSAQVVDRPLEPGKASVQLSLPGADTSFASFGLLKLRLQAGRLVGEVSGVDDEFSAEFEGPFTVTCAVPAASIAAEVPVSASENGLPILVVDEKFESTLCKRYATLAGRPR
jgi:hypothetical protein